jgi:ParB family chromosome partitioning protein
MNMQSVSLSALEASGANPRRKFDRKAIEGLAASIRTDGLLHNLVVKPLRGKRNRFEIVAGEMRFKAMKLLEDRGELPEDFEVKVEVRDDLSKDDALRIATVENLQRQNMTPLEEAAALTKLVHKGVTLDDVVAQTGLSASTIKRRLALNALCADAKKALTKGTVSLSQAEALTLGSKDAQQRILERISEGGEFSADEIRGSLLDDRPTVAMAIFPAEKYTGTITTDLFAEDETTYYDDTEQFFALQREAVEALVKHHQATSAWVEVTEEYNVPDWRYRKAKKKEPKGVLINLSPSGEVEVIEGLAKTKMDDDTAEAIAENPIAPAKAKAAYSKPLCQYIAHHKTAALAEILLSSPRAAQEVMVVKKLAAFRPHPAIRAFEKETAPQGAYGVLEAQARSFAGKLGFAIEEDESVWQNFPPYRLNELAIYEAVRGLSDHDLNGLQTLLTALSFSQESSDRLDAKDSLFNRVARDLAVNMTNHWRPDAAFLAKRNREQLVAVAIGSGYVDAIGQLSKYKKADLVNALARYFESAKAASDPTEQQKKARAWLPEAMLFPAVDPNMSTEEDVDEESDDPDTE